MTKSSGGRVKAEKNGARTRPSRTRAHTKEKVAETLDVPREETTGNAAETVEAAPVNRSESWSEASGRPHFRSRDRHRVEPEQLGVAANPESLPESPRPDVGLLDLVSPIGRRALELALTAREANFHVFVAVDPEVTVEAAIAEYARQFTEGRGPAADIVYVHDFERPEAPRPLVIPPGDGPRLVQAMSALILQLREEISSVEDRDDVQASQTRLSEDLDARTRDVLKDLEMRARSLGFGVRPVQGGVQTFPILHGKPVSAEQFGVLDDSTKRALSDAEERLTREVERAARTVKAQGDRVAAAREQALSEAARRLIEAAVAAAVGNFHNDDIRQYLEQVREALSEDWHDLIASEPGGEEPGDGEGGDNDPELATRLNRFRVNLLVANDPAGQAPVIYDINPTYPNLFGYLERRARFGALLTDFTRVRAGSLQRASGGVLVLRASDLLADPIIWERMKRILREGQLGAEDPLGPLGLYATSLRPVPAPIRVRVVLVGPHELYATLMDADPDFASLFRIKVEVEAAIERTPDTLLALDGYLMNMARRRDWGRFDRTARAKLLDYATRLAGDKEKLALNMSPLEEVAAFASALAVGRVLPPEVAARARPSSPTLDEKPYRASIAPPTSAVVTSEDVELAWSERRARAGAAERQIRALTLRGDVVVETSGFRVGVVNGLSVLSTGDVEFGQPMRITAIVALGREGIVDVEREAQLGGSIHTKGVAILRGYLGKMFGQERPLSLRAQIAFEQSYGEIDGDSASSSELFAVLSAIADVGVDQGIAVTGSVNQLGEMQTIGGVCAKIEGFFELCVVRGLTGAQGVIVPRSNLPHLVLRDDVIRAVESGKFHIYAVSTAVEGLEILTDLPAGVRDSGGRFPAGSVFGRVERRLIEISERLRQAESSQLPEVTESALEPDGRELSEVMAGR